MGTLDEAITTAALVGGRGSRRYRTLEEKRRIVEASLVKGASVAVIARQFEVNANQLFAWRRLYQQGLLDVRDAGVALAMLPVKVSEPTKRTIRAARQKRASAPVRYSVAKVFKQTERWNSTTIHYVSGVPLQSQEPISRSAIPICGEKVS
jgi:transposase